MKKPESKKCEACGNMFSFKFRNVHSKYCLDESCLRKRKSIVNKKARQKRNARMESDPLLKCEHVYKSYKSRSPRRNLSFDLTLNTFIKHFNDPCYYCGNDYDGISFDRVVNTKGYTEDNIVPCCHDCNRMKTTVSHDRFIKLCKSIARNHETKL